MKTWTCERCGSEKEIPSWITNVSLDTCQRCGTPHTVSRKWAATAVPPELESYDERGNLRLSPWYHGKYRPYKQGIYQCQFQDGVTVILEWDSKHWMWGQFAVTDPVAKWRGCWHPSEVGRAE